MITSRYRIHPAALAVALYALTAFGLAAPARAAGPIPSGTTVTGTLLTDLDSAHANVGDPFRVAVTRPYPAGDVSYAGATVRGHVAGVTGRVKGAKHN